MSQEDVQALLQSGIAAAKEGDKEIARHLLAEAANLAPNYEPVWLWLAAVATTPEETIVCLKRVLAMNPTHKQALAGIKWAEAQRLETEKGWECPICRVVAAKQAERCAACQSVVRLADPKALLNNIPDQERLKTAIKAIQETEILGQEDAFQRHYALGLAHLNLKQITSGIAHLKSAFQLRPQDTTLQTELGRLLRHPLVVQALDNKAEQAPPSFQGIVLVVDDSPTICQLVTMTLSKHNYQVITAADGLAGLARLADTSPDLILLDITMPRMDGYQVCKVIRENKETKHIPVIMLSAKDGFFDKMRGRMVGSTEYIAKPFQPEMLLQTVEKHLLH